jgi:ABC-type multidrug transport system fused ATPase/permease subunit
VNGRIEFSKVNFSYPSRPTAQVLSNLSFVAEPGTRLAIVGKSGSGKTSIINLLMKHYKPNDGHVSKFTEIVLIFNLDPN